MELHSRQKITRYSAQSPEAFRQTITQSGVSLQPEVTQTLLPPNGIYVSPETKNSYFEYSSGVTEGLRYEQYVTGYYQDLALTAEYFAAVFVVELPKPTVPVYINSRTTLTFNSILQLSSLPILKGIEKISLEGDFSEFFTVYSRDGHALDAFTTVVPNLMVDMLTSGSQYDVEFADKYVYFYRQYSPTYIQGGGQDTTLIRFSSQDYIAMKDFGIKYGKQFARAARPSTGDTLADLRPFWQLVHINQAANNSRQMVQLIWILAYLFSIVVLWFIVIPLSLIWFGLRSAQWFVRKRRLISRWKGRI